MKMKSGSVAVFIALARHIKACDVVCAGIYTVDVANCACVPFEWMECHPQYSDDGASIECNQHMHDVAAGRDTELNPYIDEGWYAFSLRINCDGYNNDCSELREWFDSGEWETLIPQGAIGNKGMISQLSAIIILTYGLL